MKMRRWNLAGVDQRVQALNRQLGAAESNEGMARCHEQPGGRDERVPLHSVDSNALEKTKGTVKVRLKYERGPGTGASYGWALATRVSDGIRNKQLPSSCKTPRT